MVAQSCIPHPASRSKTTNLPLGSAQNCTAPKKNFGKEKVKFYHSALAKENLQSQRCSGGLATAAIYAPIGPASQHPLSRQRLECGAFSTAFPYSAACFLPRSIGFPAFVRPEDLGWTISPKAPLPGPLGERALPWLRLSALGPSWFHFGDDIGGKF
jgi:hypothetical protein